MQFAQTHCQGDTYSSIVEITSPELLVSVIQAISDNNSDNWVSLTRTSCPYIHCRVLPWATDSAPGGVLYLLPPGTAYVITDYVSDHGTDSSTEKRSASLPNRKSYKNDIRKRYLDLWNKEASKPDADQKPQVRRDKREQPRLWDQGRFITPSGLTVCKACLK